MDKTFPVDTGAISKMSELHSAWPSLFQWTNRHTCGIWNLLELNGTEHWSVSLESCVLSGLFLTKMAAGVCSCAASESMPQLKERSPVTSNRERPCDIAETRLLLEAERTPTVMMQLWHHKWHQIGKAERAPYVGGKPSPALCFLSSLASQRTNSINNNYLLSLW